MVTNTGDDFEHCGLTICPDTDSVLYAVSQTIDPQRGWGRAQDSLSVFEALKSLGGPDWFQLGDKDLALHLARAAMLAAGHDLAGVTRALEVIHKELDTAMALSGERDVRNLGRHNLLIPADFEGNWA